MSLYSKKLSGMRMLERERQRLLREQKELGKSSLTGLFLENLQSRKKERGGKAGAASAIELLEPLLQKLLEELTLQTSDKKKEGETKPARKQGSPLLEKALKAGRKIAVEILSGYAKWKAIEVAAKYLAKQLRKPKTK